MKRVLREAFWAEAERLPPGADYVVVARPDARELAEREGMPGVRTALAELVGPASARARAPRRERGAPGSCSRPCARTSASISPALPRRCKYHPSCSAYAVQAVESYGILRGVVLAVWRVLRCNPFSHGGFDPVSAQTLFPAPRRSDSSHSQAR